MVKNRILIRPVKITATRCSLTCSWVIWVFKTFAFHHIFACLGKQIVHTMFWILLIANRAVQYSIGALSISYSTRSTMILMQVFTKK